MRLARLSLAAFILALAACSNDVTAPELRGPSGPAMNGTLFGSGLKAGSDSVSVNTNATISAAGLP